jgi:hypothetical protein
MSVMSAEHDSTGARTPLSDLDAEARLVLERAAAAGISLRAVGGLAVRMLCPSALYGPLARSCKDLDVVGLSAQSPQLQRLLTELGYVADADFNLYQGASRLSFADPVSGRPIDVFLDRLTMCHELELVDRLELVPLTLDPADLLLTKLQVVETNERDLQDATALLADARIDSERVAAVLAADWGWWRTATEVLGRVTDYSTRLADRVVCERAVGAAAELRETIDRHPKSRRWKLRARVGERVRWYDLPEEVES